MTAFVSARLVISSVIRTSVVLRRELLRDPNVEVLLDQIGRAHHSARRLGSERFGDRLVGRRAFEALTPGRQRSYLYHFAAAKQAATRVAGIDKAMPAIFEGRGFLERR
jgi:hypothetical protein